MSFFHRLFSRKESEAYSLLAQNVQGRPVFTPIEYQKLAKEGYAKNAIAYRCINMIASAIKSIHFTVYLKSADGTLKELDTHPFLKVLRAPNPLMPGVSYWEAITSYRLLSGNAFVHMPGVEKGKAPRELWPLRPDMVKIIPGPFAMPQAFEIQVNGGTKKTISCDPLGIKTPSILHMKRFSAVDPWYGMSPIEAAAFSIDQHNEAGKWNVGLLQNSARPSGAFIFKRNIRPDQKEQIRTDLNERYAGAGNAGRNLLLEGDVDYKAFSFSPKDMEWIESKQTSARDIATAFGVPAMLLGIPGDNTYANYKEARQAFWIETVIPEADTLCDYHTSGVLPTFGQEGVYLGYDKDALDAMSPSRDALWTRVKEATHLTLNEKRVATGYEEKTEPEYDEVLISTSLVPAGLLEETTQGSGTNATAALADENNPNDGSGSGVAANPKDPNTQDGTDPALDNTAKKWQHKIFNARTKTQRKRVWAVANRRRKAHERGFAKSLSNTFRDEGERVALAVKKAPIDGQLSAAKQAIDQNAVTFTRVIRANFKSIGEDFGRATMSAAKDEYPIVEKKDDVWFDSFLNHWIENNTARRVANISATTKRKIQKAIQTSFENEESTDQMADRISETYKGFSDSRAMLIARTETVAASNAAALGAAQATEVPNLEKEWISSNDDRSRDGDPETTDHRAVDGVRVGLEEKFEVPSADGTDLMDGPGDPDAPVGQIANCRCTLGFVQKGEK